LPQSDVKSAVLDKSQKRHFVRHTTTFLEKGNNQKLFKTLFSDSACFSDA
jgi:hypothetical protein